MSVDTSKRGPGRPKKDVLRTPEIYVEPWSCGKCGKTLSRIFAIKRHMRSIHNAPFLRVDRERRIGYPLTSSPS